MKKNEAISILATSARPREQKDRERYDEAVKMAVDALNEPERKTGKWICSDDLYETAICPFCGWDTTEPYGHIRSWFRYCPRCGARLVQEGEDTGKTD